MIKLFANAPFLQLRTSDYTVHWPGPRGQISRAGQARIPPQPASNTFQLRNGRFGSHPCRKITRWLQHSVLSSLWLDCASAMRLRSRRAVNPECVQAGSCPAATFRFRHPAARGISKLGTMTVARPLQRMPPATRQNASFSVQDTKRCSQVQGWSEGSSRAAVITWRSEGLLWISIACRPAGTGPAASWQQQCECGDSCKSGATAKGSQSSSGGLMCHIFKHTWWS